MIVDTEKKINIEITTKTVLKIVGILSIVAFVIYFKAIVLMIITAFIIMAAFRPLYLFLTMRKVSKGVAAILIVFVVVLFIGGLFSILSIPIVNELEPFIEQFPQMVSKMVGMLRMRFPFLQNYLNEEFTESFLSRLSGEFGSQIGKLVPILWETISSTFGVIGAVLTIVTVFVLSIYMLVERDSLLDKVTAIFDKDTRDKIRHIFEKVESQIGIWLRGQLLLCGIIGIVTWLVLLMIGVKYAGALGVTAGILEILPIVGPILATIPIAIGGFSAGIWQGICALTAVFFIQQIGNSILVPLVMKRAVGLNPVVTLLAIIIGEEIASWYGAFIAIPITAIITVIVREWLVLRGIIEKEQLVNRNSK